MRCLGNCCGEVVEGMGFGYCEDAEENVSLRFFPILYVLSLPLCIIVYSFVWVSICNVL